MLPKASAGPSPHAEAAKALIGKFRALREEILYFTTDLTDSRALNGGAVPESFVEAVSAAVQQSTRLEQAGGADATMLRDAWAYTVAYEPVVQELLAMAKFLSHSIRVQRNAAGLSALDVYTLAKRLSKRQDGAELRPFVADMRVKLGKKGRPRKANSDPAPATAPVLPAPPAKE
ncbi:MAG TPA: hypothetical protein VF432_13160 [Thermoanaerobaculia bacterium]